MTEPLKSNKDEASVGRENEQPILLPELLADLNDSSPSNQIISAFFSGPVPLPSILKRYDEIVPGSAKEIISNSLEQSKHRRRLEAARVTGNELRASQGLYIGGLLALGCIISGTVLGLHGQPWLAGVLFTTTIAGILSSFIYSHQQRQAEIAKKAELKEELTKSEPPMPITPKTPE